MHDDKTGVVYLEKRRVMQFRHFCAKRVSAGREPWRGCKIGMEKGKKGRAEKAHEELLVSRGKKKKIGSQHASKRPGETARGECRNLVTDAKTRGQVNNKSSPRI